MSRSSVVFGFSLLAVLMFVIGCSDMGTQPPKLTVVPSITSLQPDSAFAGDTLTILGSNFGASQGSSTVTVGGAIADTVFSWSGTAIIVKIPAAAVTGSVVVKVAGTASNAVTFRVRGTSVPDVSFGLDVFPVFQNNGCIGCHGGNNNFFLDTYAHLMSGTSLHGPVVTPGDGEGSVIIRKLRGIAGFGNRMPQGGPYLDDPTIAKISLWITQGAKNN